MGAETYRKELFGQMKKQLGAEHYGKERQETAAAHAEGVRVEEMKRRRWGEEALGRRAKGDAGQAAERLRAVTTATVKSMEERQQMGAPRCVNHLLYLHRKKEWE